MISFAPYGFIAVGLTLPDVLQCNLIRLQRVLFPTYRERLLRHEAGHFLVGYLSGLPIKGYTANSVVNAVQLWPLRDVTTGPDRARALGFDVPAPGTQGQGAQGQRGGMLTGDDIMKPSPPSASNADLADEAKDRWRRRELAALTERVFGYSAAASASASVEVDGPMDPRSVWPFRGIDHATIDRLAVVSLAGVMAEVVEFGYGEGGFADLSQLQALLNAAQPELDDDQQQAKVRWAAVMSCALLRNHQGVMEELVEKMSQGASVGECIRAIEGCGDVAGHSLLVQQRIAERRERYGEQSIAERLLLRQGQGRRDSKWQGVRRGGGDDGSGSGSGPGPGAGLIPAGAVLPLASATTAMVMVGLYLDGAFSF